MENDTPGSHLSFLVAWDDERVVVYIFFNKWELLPLMPTVRWLNLLQLSNSRSFFHTIYLLRKAFETSLGRIFILQGMNFSTLWNFHRTHRRTGGSCFRMYRGMQEREIYWNNLTCLKHHLPRFLHWFIVSEIIFIMLLRLVHGTIFYSFHSHEFRELRKRKTLNRNA